MVSKFKPRPSELRALPDLPNIEDVARFAAGAETRSFNDEPVAERNQAEPQLEVPTTSAPVRRARPASTEERRWERFDKDARPHSGINLRLNNYEHELLKALADDDERSLQQTIKRLLIPSAEAAAAQLGRR